MNQINNTSLFSNWLTRYFLPNQPAAAPTPASPRSLPLEYASTQLELKTPEREQILEFARELIEPPDLTPDGLETLPHITVKYGIEDPDDSVLREILQRESPVRVTLGKTGVFNSDKYDVVNLEVCSPDLERLHRLIERSAPTHDTFLVYRPHLTLGYARAGRGSAYACNPRFAGLELEFDRVIFSNREQRKTQILFKG